MDKSIEIRKRQGIEYYLYIFIIMSICGWIMEFFYSSITSHKINIPGFLYGPYCPIYGIGTVIVIAFCDDKNLFMKISKIFLLTTTLEYVTSVMLEIIVGRKWWNYSNCFLNINGRVSLLYSTYWVGLGFIILKFLKPILEKSYNNIKSQRTTKIINVFILGIIVDLILSIIYYI